MSNARQRAHALRNGLPHADAAIVERLLESIASPSAAIEQQQLDTAIQTGLDSLGDGGGKDGEAIFNRLEAELDREDLNRGA